MRPRQRIALLTNNLCRGSSVSYVLKTRTRSTCEIFSSWFDFKPHMKAGEFDAVLIVNCASTAERRDRLLYAAEAIMISDNPVPVAFWDVWPGDAIQPVAGARWFAGRDLIGECVEWARCPRGARLTEAA